MPALLETWERTFTPLWLSEKVFLQLSENPFLMPPLKGIFVCKYVCSYFVSVGRTQNQSSEEL